MGVGVDKSVWSGGGGREECILPGARQNQLGIGLIVFVLVDATMDCRLTRTQGDTQSLFGGVSCYLKGVI